MTVKLKFGLPVLFEGLNHADCRDICTFWDDFLDSSMSIADELSRWKSTIVGNGGVVGALLDGTDASQELSGGIVALTVGGTVSEASSMLVNGQAFQMAKGHELYFEARWTQTDTDISTFVGLSSFDSDEIATDASCIADMTGASNEGAIGFLTVGAVLSTSVAKGTANIDAISGITIAALTWNRAAFHFDGIDTIKFYFAQNDDEMVEVNSLSLTTALHYIPDDIMLTPTLEAEEETSGGAGSMYVDYVLCQQARQRVAD